MVFVMSLQSMLSFLLIRFYDNPAQFEKQYVQSNSRLAKSCLATRKQLVSLLDFNMETDQKKQNQVPFAYSFNLFMEQGKTRLPDCLSFHLQQKTNFRYDRSYCYRHAASILHPPR